MILNCRTLISDVTSCRQAWLEARRNRISATKIGTIAGLNWFKSALECWAEDTGKVPVVEDDDEAGFLEYGRTNEPLVRKRTAKELGIELVPANALYQHKDFDWAIASPDAFTPDRDFLAELKTATARADHLWSEDHAPEMYKTQITWQMGVMDGPKRGCLSCMIGGDPRDIRIHRVKFDPDEFESLLAIAEGYRELVKRDIPPDPGPGDSKLIQKIYAKREAETIRLTGPDAIDVENLILELRTIKLAKSRADEGVKLLKYEIRKLENKLKMKLGAHEVGVLPSGAEVRAKLTTVEPYMNPGYSYVKVTLPKQRG